MQSGLAPHDHIGANRRNRPLGVRQVGSNAREPIVQLGAAVPDPDYLPTQAVARAVARVARLQRTRAAGYMMPPGAPELRRQMYVQSYCEATQN